MGEGVAMRHTWIRRVEDAEELGPQEPPPWVERGWTPLPLRLHVVGLLRSRAASTAPRSRVTRSPAAHSSSWQRSRSSSRRISRLRRWPRAMATTSGERGRSKSSLASHGRPCTSLLLSRRTRRGEGLTAGAWPLRAELAWRTAARLVNQQAFRLWRCDATVARHRVPPGSATAAK